MDWLAVIVVGGVIGYFTSVLMKTDAQQGVLLNIAVGVIGSIFGRWLFADVLGIGAAYSAGALNPPGLIFGVLGAAILIAILKVLRLLG
ncbi:MAG: GlsB/YeaQ/YmgE family stress response membrane protein [Moraxellaceae bacterium]